MARTIEAVSSNGEVARLRTKAAYTHCVFLAVEDRDPVTGDYVAAGVRPVFARSRKLAEDRANNELTWARNHPGMDRRVIGGEIVPVVEIVGAI